MLSHTSFLIARAEVMSPFLELQWQFCATIMYAVMQTFSLCSLEAGQVHELNNFVLVRAPISDWMPGWYSKDVHSMNDN